MLKIAHSMMKGLAFLHDEVYAADGHKHTMAHRDIKSKNILIKENMTAAIADFGLTQVFSDGCVNESSVQVRKVGDMTWRFYCQSGRYDMVVEHEFGTSGYLLSFIMVQEF